MLIPEEIKNQIVELYKQGLLLKEISTIVNRPYPSITYILKQRVGYSNTRPSQGNINYFENIDTHEKAYILGYIAADGNIQQDKRNYLFKISLVCNTKDKCILEFIKNQLNCETKIRDSIVYDKRTEKYYNRTSLSLGNQKLCKDLINLGIYPNKTFTLGNLLSNIPKEYRKSCILGYFDGDGHVGAYADTRVNNPLYRTYRISICSTEPFLKGIVKELELIKPAINPHKNYYTLDIYNKEDFYKLYMCYENLNFYLKRKHDIFLQRINYERTISSPSD